MPNARTPLLSTLGAPRWSSRYFRKLVEPVTSVVVCDSSATWTWRTTRRSMTTVSRTMTIAVAARSLVATRQFWIAFVYSRRDCVFTCMVSSSGCQLSVASCQQARPSLTTDNRSVPLDLARGDKVRALARQLVAVAIPVVSVGLRRLDRVEAEGRDALAQVVGEG